MAAQFDEIRFPPKISFGFEGGPTFFTTITTTTGGLEQRNQNWALARATYTCSHELRDQTELDELLGFFYARRGKAIGFRFRDWVDFCSDMPGFWTAQPTLNLDPGEIPDTLPAAGLLTPQAIGTGRVDAADVNMAIVAATHTLSNTVAIFSDYVVGTSILMAGWAGGTNNNTFVIESIATDGKSMVLKDPSGFLVNESAGPSVTVTTNGFQLKKTYATAAGTNYTRTIEKPVSGAVRMFVAAVEEAGVTVDTTTGFVTFTAGNEPAEAEAVTSDYLFDVPVRFNVDNFSSSLEHFNLNDWGNIQLIEVRET